MRGASFIQAQCYIVQVFKPCYWLAFSLAKRGLQTPPSNSAYIMSMPMRNVRMGRDGGDSRGIRTYMPIVGVANTSVAVVVLHQYVSGSYVAEESNCGKR